MATAPGATVANVLLGVELVATTLTRRRTRRLRGPRLGTPEVPRHALTARGTARRGTHEADQEVACSQRGHSVINLVVHAPGALRPACAPAAVHSPCRAGLVSQGKVNPAATTARSRSSIV
ncbi:hypothetical protein GCM10027059_21730 [Myceligenerans halotolerans]